MNRILALVFFSFFTLSSSFAQTSVSTNNYQFNLLELNNDNWSFFSDDNADVMYIDFAKLTFNISDIILTNKEGDVIFKDSVLDLPVDAIYELDLSTYKAGNYQIELRSFTSNLTKEVTVK
jgi:hypothetical protein